MFGISKKAVASIVLSILYISCYSQSPFYSGSLIKYDLSTHRTDKPIPFDRSFTLVIEKLSSKNILEVHAYEAKFKSGNRNLVKNKFTDCDKKEQKIAIKDVVLTTNPYSDTLQIFFPPLKPNIDFDVNIIYELSAECRNILMKANAELAQDSNSKSNTFDEFVNCTIDKLALRTYSDMDFSEYKTFYSTKLASHYNTLSDGSKYGIADSLTQREIQAIDLSTTQEVSNFKDGGYLIEVFMQKQFKQLQLGLYDISKVFSSVYPENMTNGPKRLQNLQSNNIFFDSLLKRIDRVLSKGVLNITVNGTAVSIDGLRTKTAAIKKELLANINLLQGELNKIYQEISANERLKQGVYLAGNTISSDLKSAGGNILFVDAGFTNIIIPGLDNKATYIPKLYWGVSIYFRPIDKNTRSNTFFRKFDPPENDGCRIENITDDKGNVIKVIKHYGPDYKIVSRWSIWQHLSLNLGLTVGSIKKKDFDNFYNNSSFLIGPAYRFARAFKISSGVALLNRTSKNPLISEKKVTAGGYISLSVDIDLIQSIKDITSILFK